MEKPKVVKVTKTLMDEFIDSAYNLLEKYPSLKRVTVVGDKITQVIQRDKDE